MTPHLVVLVWVFHCIHTLSFIYPEQIDNKQVDYEGMLLSIKRSHETLEAKNRFQTAEIQQLKIKLLQNNIKLMGEEDDIETPMDSECDESSEPEVIQDKNSISETEMVLNAIKVEIGNIAEAVSLAIIKIQDFEYPSEEVSRNWANLKAMYVADLTMSQAEVEIANARIVDNTFRLQQEIFVEESILKDIQLESLNNMSMSLSDFREQLKILISRIAPENVIQTYYNEEQQDERVDLDRDGDQHQYQQNQIPIESQQHYDHNPFFDSVLPEPSQNITCFYDETSINQPDISSQVKRKTEESMSHKDDDVFDEFCLRGGSSVQDLFGETSQVVDYSHTRSDFNYNIAPPPRSLNPTLPQRTLFTQTLPLFQENSMPLILEPHVNHSLPSSATAFNLPHQKPTLSSNEPISPIHPNRLALIMSESNTPNTNVSSTQDDNNERWASEIIPVLSVKAKLKNFFTSVILIIQN